MTNNELGALIAEKVMGWVHVVKPEKLREAQELREKADNESFSFSAKMLRIHARECELEADYWVDADGERRFVPAFAEDIGAAWQVLENFTFPKVWFDQEGAEWCCEVVSGDHLKRTGTARASTAPRAICLSALSAMGVEL